MALDIIRKKDEDIVDYMIRLYENKAKYGLNNQEIADLLNREEGTEYDESRWRKLYQAWENFFEPYVTERFDDAEGYNSHILNKYELLRIENEKEKVRLRDVKREYNKLIREEARFENLKDELIQSVKTIEPINMPVSLSKPSVKKEAMVIISDLHVGMIVDSEFNKYNVEIAKERLNKLKQRTYDKIKQEDITKLHVVNLGDILHGLIHVSARVDSEIGVIKQLTVATEMLKSFIQTFLDEGIEVDFKSVPGNHSRLLPSVNELDTMEENFEKLIPTMLNESFQNYPNFSSTEDKEGLITFDVSGQKIALAHGNLDKGANAVNKLTQLTGEIFRYLFTGHVHHEFVKEHGYTTHFGVGSASGLDNYAISGRFSGRPSQKLIVFGEKDIEENITVYLN